MDLGAGGSGTGVWGTIGKKGAELTPSSHELDADGGRAGAQDLGGRRRRVARHVDQGDALALLVGERLEGVDQIECVVGEPVGDARDQLQGLGIGTSTSSTPASAASSASR